jgi:hypothetical protein
VREREGEKGWDGGEREREYQRESHIKKANRRQNGGNEFHQIKHIELVQQQCSTYSIQERDRMGRKGMWSAQ